MELNSQVATLQDEVKLLKGEIKAVLKEIRTAVLSQDNPFSVDSALPALPKQSRGAEPEEEPVMVKRIVEVPDVESIHIPTFGAPAPAQPVAPAPGQPAAPTVTNIIRYPGAPSQQVAPTAVIQPAVAPGPELLPPATQLSPEGYGEAASDAPAPAGDVTAEGEYEDASAAAEPPAGKRPPARTRKPDGNDQPTWTLASVAGLAVWAEEALQTLGPRRYRFVLKLAAFAELLPDTARELLAELDDSDEDDPGDEVPVSVNECLVVLRQLDAIVHGERVIRLPRRRGSRLRRVR